MRIYIPTLGREGRQITLQGIPDNWKKRVYIVCPKSENHDWPNRIDVPDSCIGSISKTRQWIVEYSAKNSFDPNMAMIDDDVTFYKIDPIHRTKRTSDKVLTEQFFDLMNTWLDEGDVFCGSSNSFMSHEKPSEYYYGKPSHCCFLNSEYLMKNNIRYDAVEYFEDFHVPLAILESGKRLRYTGDYISIEKKANAKGGCSINRNAERNRQAMIELQKLHPQWITLKEDEEAENQTLKVGLKMRIAFKKLYDEKVLGNTSGLESFFG